MTTTKIVNKLNMPFIAFTKQEIKDKE